MSIVSVRRYRRLDAAEVVKTAALLERRVNERFPDSGLGKVAAELLAVSNEAVARAEWIARPILWLRLGIGALLAALIAIGVATVLTLDLPMSFAQSLSDLLQGLDAGVNGLVFLSLSIFFLMTLEKRIKRERALKAIHELRSIAHIIDMHQLTKDPERVFAGHTDDTRSSPVRNMSPAQLSRYLDYASENLALVGKIGALYAERFNDAVALAAVDEVENLVSGLSRKIWQKIMIIVDYRKQETRKPGKRRKASRR